MQRMEVSCAVRRVYTSLGAKGLRAAKSAVTGKGLDYSCVESSRNCLEFCKKFITEKQIRLLELAEIHYKRANRNPRFYAMNVTMTNPVKHCLYLFCFYWKYLVCANYSKWNNHNSRKKGKCNGKWTVCTSGCISVYIFAVFESSSFTFVGFCAQQVTLLAATLIILRFGVYRAMLKVVKL